jgi:undecaprenyl diphosphate synthase
MEDLMLFKSREKKNLLTHISKSPLPNHIASIMDGNGRWAKRRGLPRTAGHHEGGKTLLKVLKACNNLNINALTVYAFSTENWKRPKEEVDYLMDLPSQYIDKYLPMIKEENIRINFIGHLEVLTGKIKENIEKAMLETQDNTGLIFTIALNYGSQSELIRAVKQIVVDVVDQNLSIDEITEQSFSKHLMTSNLPPLDLLIRTSGEVRLSNFLLWQAAYSELIFTDKYWPDFTEKELYTSIQIYQKRHRRYGGL